MNRRSLFAAFAGALATPIALVAAKADPKPETCNNGYRLPHDCRCHQRFVNVVHLYDRECRITPEQMEACRRAISSAAWGA